MFADAVFETGSRCVAQAGVEYVCPGLLCAANIGEHSMPVHALLWIFYSFILSPLYGIYYMGIYNTQWISKSGLWAGVHLHDKVLV